MLLQIVYALFVSDFNTALGMAFDALLALALIVLAGIAWLSFHNGRH